MGFFSSVCGAFVFKELAYVPDKRMFKIPFLRSALRLPVLELRSSALDVVQIWFSSRASKLSFGSAVSPSLVRIMPVGPNAGERFEMLGKRVRAAF